MDTDVAKLGTKELLAKLASLFDTQAHDRHVYCVFGPYCRLRPFQSAIREQVRQGNLNSGSQGKVLFLSLNREDETERIVRHRSRG